MSRIPLKVSVIAVTALLVGAGIWFLLARVVPEPEVDTEAVVADVLS